MPKLSFPVILTDDVQIITRTDDGFYIIKFKKSDGSSSVIWLPDTLILQTPIDSSGGKAIEMVKDYIAEQLQMQYPYLKPTDEI